jgi:hypothetical protein
MSFDDFRERAALLRAVPLEAVLLCRGAERDLRDRRKWHTEQGPLSLTGAKFMSWRRYEGGGGAIDLVMHLGGVDHQVALEWLEEHFGAGLIPGRSAARPLARAIAARGPRGPLRLPPPVNRRLDRVRQ